MDRRLPDVLLQLIAQQLMAADKIRLARCSTPLLHAINHAFAWRGSIAPLRFCMPPQRSTTIPSLLRHSAIGLRVESPRHPRPDDLAALTAVMRSCRLAELDLSQCCQVTVPQWKLLCELLRAQQASLRSLSLYQDLAESNQQVLEMALHAAPQLTTLRFRTLHDHFGPRASTGVDLLLALAPNLTDLCVAEGSLNSWGTGRRLMIAALRNLTLRSLSILRPHLYENDGGWVLFFADPVAQGLEKLRLHTYFPLGRQSRYNQAHRRAVSEAQMIAGWCSMHRLHALELVHVADIDAMLPYLRFAPVLRALLIVPDCSLPPVAATPKVASILAALAPGSQPPPPPVLDLNEHPVPSVAALMELLRTAPQLRCKLTLQRPALLSKECDQLRHLDLHLEKLSSPFTAAGCALFDDSSVAGRFTFALDDCSARAEARGV